MLATVLSGCGTPLPPNAPFAFEECGLPANTRLAFAGWVEYQLLGHPANRPFGREELVYAAVAADRVQLRPMVGPATENCSSLADGPADAVDLDGGGNTIGTILYQVALIEVGWLYSEILEREPGAEIKALLPADDRDADGVLSVVTGESLNQHLARLARVRADLLDRLRGMSIEDFHRPPRLPGYDVSPAWVLHHLAQHEASTAARSAQLPAASAHAPEPPSGER